MTFETRVTIPRNLQLKMADRVEGSPEASAPMEPDTSENAPLLQEQEHQNVNLGPPPPFIASK